MRPYIKIADFTNKYEEQKTIVKRPNGSMAILRERTKVDIYSSKAGRVMGRKIRALRKEQGLTLEELTEKSGLKSTTPKSRMWEIERGSNGGLKFGTVYCLAEALNCTIHDLIPTREEIENEPIPERPIKCITEINKL